MGRGDVSVSSFLTEYVAPSRKDNEVDNTS